MAVHVVANEKAKEEFIIPVSWEVFGTVKVQANSLTEAFEYVEENIDEIPIDDDTDYVDGSYEIAADDPEGCLAYHSRNITCLNFSCEDNLAEYSDSMLFDRSVIASADFYCGVRKMSVNLEVCGEVALTYKDEVYNAPSEFPEELKKLIKEDRDWMNNEDVVVNLNNWFEYLIPEAGEGFVCEDDISKMAPEDILEEFRSIAKNFIETPFNG